MSVSWLDEQTEKSLDSSDFNLFAGMSSWSDSILRSEVFPFSIQGVR